MKIIIGHDYESMSARAAEQVLKLIKDCNKPLLCIATGDSPKGFYKSIIEKIKKENIDISDWHFVGLDEWMGMNVTDEGSCRYHLENDLLKPLNVPQNRVCFFDGRAKNIQNEIEKTENFIKEQGGIEVAIVGLGMNGHVGMNEPGTDPFSHSHIATIDPETQKDGQKYFTKAQMLSKGITLGIADIMDARNVILLINGAKKARIVQQVLEEEISPALPASLLRRHKHYTVYLEKEAAQFLQKSNA